MFMMPLHPPGRDYSETLREDREAIMLADQLGFAEAFVGEHVTDLAETVTSCLTFLASLGDATQQIKLGSGTVNMPNSHPAAVAAHVSMVDHLLDGRFLFGISPGGLRSDMEVFGNLDADRGTPCSRRRSTRCWRSGRGSRPTTSTASSGRSRPSGRWTSRSARAPSSSRCSGRILRSSWRRCRPSRAASASAGERGWSFISANFLQPVWAAYTLAEVRRGVRGGEVASRVGIRLACRQERLRRRRRRHRAGRTRPTRLGAYGNYYASLMRKLIGNGRADLFKHDQSMADEEVTLEYVMESLVIYGTPASVTEQILELRETVGDFGTLVYAGHDWVDPALARRSMELMATEVMPAVNAALGE